MSYLNALIQTKGTQMYEFSRKEDKASVEPYNKHLGGKDWFVFFFFLFSQFPPMSQLFPITQNLACFHSKTCKASRVFELPLSQGS